MSNEYKFNKTVNFEGFSDEFINNPDLTPELKGYLAMIYEYIRWSVWHYRDADLAKLTHLTRRTILTYNNQLQDLGFMVNGRGTMPDVLENGGCKSNVKIYDPRSYGQAVVFVLQSRLNDIQDEQRKNIEELTAEIKNLKRQQAISEQRSQKLHDENKELLKTNKRLYDALKLYRDQHKVTL